VKFGLEFYTKGSKVKFILVHIGTLHDVHTIFLSSSSSHTDADK